VQSRWTDHYLWTSDNVRLHYRDFAGGREGQPALLCLPGLTRNARDFESLADRLSPRFRVVTPSFRGRGDSGYARDPLSYVPLSYLQDLGRLLEHAGLARLIIIGTSLGGLMGLLLDGTQRSRIAGLVLNDLGPAMEEAGLQRRPGGSGRERADLADGRPRHRAAPGRHLPGVEAGAVARTCQAAVPGVARGADRLGL
jgi:pimeloyl-ACP methyl ester carboxylesterase